MSLLICVRSIKDVDRELCMYQSKGTYRIRYEHRNQTTTLKSEITDSGYANYLFDMYAEDLHMEENSMEEDIYDDIDFFKEKIDKYRISLIKNKGGNNKARVNRRSSDISSLIELQTKITEIILKNYGEFRISDNRLDEFIENQKHIRKCIGEKDYSKTSYGSKLNRFLITEENLATTELKDVARKITRDVVKGMLAEEV